MHDSYPLFDFLTHCCFPLRVALKKQNYLQMKLPSFPVFLLALLLLPVCLPAQSTLKRAEKEFEIGDFQRAVMSYKEVLATDPDNLVANAGIADCYRYLNDFNNALIHYENAVSKSGVSELTVFQYGLVLQGLGRYEQAQKVFDRLAKQSPEFRTRAKQFSDACKFALSADAPSAFKVTNEFANSKYADFGPAFFGKEQLVYASSRPDIATKNSRNAPGSGNNYDNRLFVTQRDINGFLETPQSLHDGFGSHGNEGPIAYTKDGQMVAITKNNFRNGVRQIPHAGLELTLYLAEADATGSWKSAKAFVHNGAGYSTGYPCFSPDGKALFFASDRPGGYGGYDLYVSYRTGASWSTPENLGPAVNTLGNEITPFFDGSALYFASDFHKGFGGFDIFKVEENDGRWSTVYHMGNGINSSADDYGFIFDELRNIGYFISNRPGGKGNEDLYRVVKESDNIVFKVTDAATGKPLAGAVVDFSNCNEGTFTTSENGIFMLQLREPLNCAATIRMQGYTPQSVDMNRIGLRPNRTIEVALVNVAGAYEGRVVDAINRVPLADVKVIATDRATGERVEAGTNSRGAYLIALNPKSTYLIRYSKPGYRDVSQTVIVDPASKRLDDIGIFPVNAPVATAEPAAITKEAAQPKAARVATRAISGYSVQLAAVSKEPNLAEIRSQLNVGEVYAHREGKIYKIRVGVFPDRQDAEQALKVCKEKGYSGAFIVEDTGRPAVAQVETMAPKTAAPELPVLQDGYAIQLLALKDASKFDRSKVEQLGEVQIWPKGEWQVVLLTGFDSRSSAEVVLRRAKALGYSGAYLVEVVNGELRKAR